MNSLGTKSLPDGIRIEKVRELVDEILLNMSDPVEQRCAYLHLYGIAQACALLALKRGEDVELAVIAGMLHDIYSYANMDSQEFEIKEHEQQRFHSLRLEFNLPD